MGTSNVDPSKRDQLQNVVGSIVQMLGSASAAIHGTDPSATSHESVPVSSKKEQEKKPVAKGSKQEATNVVKSDVNDDTQASMNHGKRASIPGGLKKQPSNNNIKSLPITNDTTRFMESNIGVAIDNQSNEETKN